MSTLPIEELKNLVEQAKSPCISLYMPTYQAGSEVQQNPIRFKNLIRQAESLLQEQHGLRQSDVKELLQPALALDKNDFWQHQNSGLAIFVSENFFRYYCLPLSFEELVIAGDRFHFKPLMPLLTGDGTFYLLALSQKQIRFFEGTRHSIHEIELEDIPTNMEDALMYDETAKEGQFRLSSPRGSTGNSFRYSGSFHGQGSPDQDNPQEDLLQFFHIVDRGLQKYLHDEKAPLLLAGVEYLLPIYQEANTYANLMAEIIPIENIGVIKPEDLLEPAWSQVEPYYTQSRQAAIEHYHELAGTGQTSTDLKETIVAAYYGRIDQLFVSVDTQKWGNFDPQANQLDLHAEAEPGDDDLLNEAALQTLLTGEQSTPLKQTKYRNRHL
ncbi:baeRF3 domain-containing protein [Egbenema bharatensis]|uniref:baeRF3 domain-containing protein n=1 Tax=Egbenema bharatensis TaxID=3463334 RepID=UPI003A868563